MADKTRAKGSDYREDSWSPKPNPQGGYTPSTSQQEPPPNPPKQGTSIKK